MTGVGTGNPRDFREFAVDTRKRLVALERRQSISSFGLPAYITTGDGLQQSGSGQVGDPLVFSVADRLGSTGQEVTNWNDAVEPGFYWSESSGTNAPHSGSAWVGQVLARDAGGGTVHVRQSVSELQPLLFPIEWSRIWDGSTWSPWMRSDGLLRPGAVSAGGTIQDSGEVTFTVGTGGVNITGVFTTTFRHYRVLIDIESVGSPATTFFMRFTLGGVPITASNYDYLRLYGSSSSATSVASTSQGRFEIAPGSSIANTTGGTSVMDLVVYQPAQSGMNTRINGTIAALGNASGAPVAGTIAGQYMVAGAHDGIAILPSATTATGRVSIYGLV